MEWQRVLNTKLGIEPSKTDFSASPQMDFTDQFKRWIYGALGVEKKMEDIHPIAIIHLGQCLIHQWIFRGV